MGASLPKCLPGYQPAAGRTPDAGRASRRRSRVALPQRSTSCYPCTLPFHCDHRDMHPDYLEKILKARVYDVAIESPLEAAPILSARLHNSLLLKREDMQ
ncbi:MAG TPA: hypothetical protein VMV87_09115, partial [Burkholderiales bacterium]|nr:hypothetical protein [Burkholderiales bacterium]